MLICQKTCSDLEITFTVICADLPHCRTLNPTPFKARIVQIAATPSPIHLTSLDIDIN
ncbi:MAG: hypothetical protein ACKPIB_17025 [Dolichospermum sp.]